MYRRAYVDMILRVAADGKVCPLEVIWENGKRYHVDEVRDVTPAARTDVGGPGMQYTLVIKRQERRFYENDGRWFTWVTTP